MEQATCGRASEPVVRHRGLPRGRVTSDLGWVAASYGLCLSAHFGGTVRKFIVAVAACAASLAVAGPAIAGQSTGSSADLAENEVAVEGITLDHEGFEIPGV